MYRHTDTQTHRHTDTQTHTHTYTHTYIHIHMAYNCKERQNPTNYIQTIGNNNIIETKDVLHECIYDTTVFVIK